VDGVPVADQDEEEQQKSDQEQTGGFRGVDGVTAVLLVPTVGRVFLALKVRHAFIVRPE